MSKKAICWLLCPKLCISARVKLSQRSSKYSEFSHVSPTCGSSIISPDANHKNNKTSYNEEVIRENTEFTDYFDVKTNRNNKMALNVNQLNPTQIKL